MLASKLYNHNQVGVWLVFRPLSGYLDPVGQIKFSTAEKVQNKLFVLFYLLVGQKTEFYYPATKGNGHSTEETIFDNYQKTE